MDLPFNNILFNVKGEMAGHVNGAVKPNVGVWPCFPSRLPHVCLSCLLLTLCYTIILVIALFSQPCHLDLLAGFM